MADEGAWNRRVGWTSMAVGVGTGLAMGLWSFGGPVDVPEWLGAYDSVSRRLVRLGHIAFLGLGILDVLLARELPRLGLSTQMKRLCGTSMIFGNVVLPPLLMAAGAFHPLKYGLPLPATAVFVSLVLAAYGTWNEGDA